MGNWLVRNVQAMTGLDVDDEDITDSSTTGSVNVPEMQLSKPKPPLHLLQIERAWMEFASVCPDKKYELFDIEQDLNLEKPVRVAILDTGVYQDHDALIGRVTRFRNFVPRQLQNDAHQDLIRDKNGHGTFCAALVVGGTYSAISQDSGLQENIFPNGVAPFARVVVGKVLDHQCRGDIDWLIKGLKWACDIDKADNRRPVNADIISISVGMPRYHPELRQVIYQALAKGKIVVCCASNEEEETSYDIQYPAKFGDVISVGSQLQNGQPTGFTPAGREIDFIGPGENVWSASSEGTHLVKCMSGTFIGAPYIAGVCALILAYADKLGGRELRRAVSNTLVMKEILKKMASLPGHHDQLAGYGNIVPYRLFKYGPQTFENEVYRIIGEHKMENAVPQEPLGPVQPVIHNFNARTVASRIRSDNDALRGLMKPLAREKIFHDWYTRLDKLLFGMPYSDYFNCRPTVLTNFPECLKTIDLSMRATEFETLRAESNIRGINVQNVIEIYFGTFEGMVETVIMPQYKYITYLGSLDILNNMNPNVIQLQNEVPLIYVLDIIKAFNTGIAETKQGLDIFVEKLILSSFDSVHPIHAKYYRELFDSFASNERKISVFVTEVIQHESSLQDQTLQILDTFLTCCSLRCRQLLEHQIPAETSRETNNNILRANIFFASDEFQTTENVPSENNPLETKVETEIIRQNSSSTFCLWEEIETLLKSSTRKRILETFPKQIEALMQTAGKEYEESLYILINSSLGENVSCLDLQLNPRELSATHVDLTSLKTDANMRLQMSTLMVNSGNVVFDDKRTVSLSAALRSISIKCSPKTMIHELVLPSLSCISDLKDSFGSLIFRKCENVYIVGETRLKQLLKVLRYLPKGDYILRIHIEKLRFCKSLDGETSRDFDAPPGVQFVVYNFVLDSQFFQLRMQKVKIIYEICLKLSSLHLLQKMKEECEIFMQQPETYHVPYSCTGCHETCKALLTYFEDALVDELVSQDGAMFFLSEDNFKFAMTTERAIQDHANDSNGPDVNINKCVDALPTNVYRSVLNETSPIVAALKSNKIKNVTVAIFAFGINTLHPEFSTKLPHIRPSSPERGCPYGDSIISFSYNAVPEESMQTFLDEECTIGTIAGALIAGNNSGAAPFANIISVKVGTASGSSNCAWLVNGIRWLLSQEEQGILPVCDVILIPFNFSTFSIELYQLINNMCSSGKVVVCPAGQLYLLEDTLRCYPAFYGDVLCIGSPDDKGENSRWSGASREIDLITCGQTSHGMVLDSCWSTAVAAAQVTGVVAYTLAYAELIGGASLRQAISNNSVMREILRQMCAKPGQHDELLGHGRLNPGEIFKHGENYFKTIVSEITEEYFEIRVQRVRTWSRSTSIAAHTENDEPRSRSSSFTSPNRRVLMRRRTFSCSSTSPTKF